MRTLHRYALAAALTMLAPLAANAADAGYTDRIIVKYRTAPANALARTAQLRGTELPAARMGLADAQPAYHCAGISCAQGRSKADPG